MLIRFFINPCSIWHPVSKLLFYHCSLLTAWSETISQPAFQPTRKKDALVWDWREKSQQLSTLSRGPKFRSQHHINWLKKHGNGKESYNSPSQLMTCTYTNKSIEKINKICFIAAAIKNSHLFTALIQRLEVLMFVSIFPQSSKCRTVLSSPQKIEGFKRLDCQSAMFNDYNFVFTSFAKKQQQQQS